MIIKKIEARKIRDSRGDWTIEVDVNGCRASSPSGKSKGKHETQPYYKSLEFCINFLNKWNEKVEINDFEDLNKIEGIIKGKLGLKKAREFGGNALFAFESALVKALAKENKKELWEIINPGAKRMPVPVGNAIGGGLHSSNKDRPAFQEFLIIPEGKNIADNCRIMKESYAIIGKIISANKVNDEGAWESSFNIKKILHILSKIKGVRIGVDAAASSFYKDGMYNYGDFFMPKKEQVEYMNQLIKKYDILYLEDPLQEDDFAGFGKIIKNNLIAGDDLTATHLERIKKAVKMKAINAVIIKPNQNGSLLEVAEIVDYCKKNKIKMIFSHRSGETLDSALADYAFGFGADYIKCGIATKWRDAKLKRLMEIDRII